MFNAKTKIYISVTHVGQLSSQPNRHYLLFCLENESLSLIVDYSHSLVIIAMEAIDQLLVACHAQSLNLFVESFLKMVQKLLESTDPQLQILATHSVCPPLFISFFR